MMIILLFLRTQQEKGYIMVLKKNKQVKKMQLLHDEVVIDTASINYDDGKENHIIVSN